MVTVPPTSGSPSRVSVTTPTTRTSRLQPASTSAIATRRRIVQRYPIREVGSNAGQLLEEPTGPQGVAEVPPREVGEQPAEPVGGHGQGGVGERDAPQGVGPGGGRGRDRHASAA